ncbi:MAG TPA: hypothetical protein VKB31_02345 [Trueperaceae bacterium]|nr:hypothetical protein [Trueperaceae bacterium]
MLTDESSSPRAAPWQVRTAHQARLLSDPSSRRYFLPFLAQTRSVKAAAEEAGCKLDAMHYRVRRFLGAGLLRVVAERPRAGRAIKLYRSVADALYVPFWLTPYAEIEERIRRDVLAEDERVVAALARGVRASGLEGRRIYRRDDGEVMVDSAAHVGPRREWSAMVRAWPEHLPVAERIGAELELTHAEARELLLAFQELADRYRRRDVAVDGGRRRYHYQIAVVPWDG